MAIATTRVTPTPMPSGCCFSSRVNGSEHRGILTGIWLPLKSVLLVYMAILLLVMAVVAVVTIVEWFDGLRRWLRE
jgi:hypothetical protein